MKVDDFFLVFNSNWAGALPKAEPPFKNPGPATGLYTKQAVACEIYMANKEHIEPQHHTWRIK